MVVKKFGGSSVKNAERINKLIDIVSNETEKCFIVVSAFGGITDNLCSLLTNNKANNLELVKTDLEKLLKAITTILNNLINDKNKELVLKKLEILYSIMEEDQLNKIINPINKDIILSRGEIISSLAIYYAMIENNMKVAYLDAREVIKTNSHFTEADVDFDLTNQLILKKVNELFSSYDYIIMPGFIGSEPQGMTTTLSRGGSDYSAAIVAQAINAKRLEIWTDVNGILTIDPRMNNNAKRILHLSYDEAAELAYFGAKVLHPKTIGPAIKKKIPVVVKNSYEPEKAGTEIYDKQNNPKMIKAISYRYGIILITIKSNRMLGAYGFLSKLFEVFKIYETPVDLIATSEVSVSLTIDEDKNLDKIINELGAFSQVNVSKSHAIVSAIGDGIKETAGIAAKFFGVLKNINIHLVSVGASEVNLSIIIDEDKVKTAVNLLHDEFFNDNLDDKVFEIKELNE